MAKTMMGKQRSKRENGKQRFREKLEERKSRGNREDVMGRGDDRAFPRQNPELVSGFE
jgi:hypothetical protein